MITQLNATLFKSAHPGDGQQPSLRSFPLSRTSPVSQKILDDITGRYPLSACISEEEGAMLWSADADDLLRAWMRQIDDDDFFDVTPDARSYIEEMQQLAANGHSMIVMAD
jgi:hypothetical protein